MKVIITRPLSTATPERAMNPTPAEMESGMPRSHRPSTPPVRAKGTPVKTSRPSLREPKALYRKMKIQGILEVFIQDRLHRDRLREAGSRRAQGLH